MKSVIGKSENVLKPDMKLLEWTSQGVEATFHAGRCLGEILQPGDVICLAGNLGAGKTVFTKGIGAGWGAREMVTSPTFTLIHEHRRPQDQLILYHIDCYRLHGMTDAWSIGLEELLHNEGILVIEWPENIEDTLPPERLWIAFDVLDDTQRQLDFSATGKRYEMRLAALQQKLFDSL
ncbi:MAG: tRNA (adenosine(37)-N6)-threonylcarbamoyltransferase complex ATPase subunit type 1 TsaE [Chloroflexi bacterium]|nr:tRNA (adenosine(37)-N6)-threonylcarbamoyltransferase complex ATPase subunit type 1 TsaE [Chloroflexota bacterium]